MLTLSFTRHTFVAGTFIATICGIIGVFAVARSLSFLTHILSEIGFVGGAFAVFAGWPVLNGMILSTMLSSVIVGQMSIEESRREAVISAVSALLIGLGILFLSLSSQPASSATGVLFSSVVEISLNEVWQLVYLSILILIILLLMRRRLKFDSFDSIGAQVSGINQTVISVVFLLLPTLSANAAAQIVDSLLTFILLTLPAASAKYFMHGVARMIILVILFSLLGIWLGLFLGYLIDWPVSFFIVVIEVIIYTTALIYSKFIESN